MPMLATMRGRLIIHPLALNRCRLTGRNWIEKKMLGCAAARIYRSTKGKGGGQFGGLSSASAVGVIRAQETETPVPTRDGG